jgi:hypothetical protein
MTHALPQGAKRGLELPSVAATGPSPRARHGCVQPFAVLLRDDER